MSIRGEITQVVSSGTSNCISSERDLRRRRQWILVRGLPAASVFVLVVWQIVALADDGVVAVHHPTGAVILACIRGCLYACFLSIPVAAFLLHDPPLKQDRRTFVRAAGIVATFLLVALGLFAPSGPLLLSVSEKMEIAVLAITVAAVAFATCAMWSLGMNFSYWPEARQLVVRGPYRFVRHPVYLAEIVMSSAVLLSSMRVTLVVGEFVVIILQLVRIRAEEGLLAGTFPIFRAFQTMTPYRLIPGLW